MSKTFISPWLSDVVDLIDKPDTNRIVCHGKEFVLVKHGYWVVDEDGNIKCSECGHCGIGDNYCERCGAKMDEASE